MPGPTSAYRPFIPLPDALFSPPLSHSRTHFFVPAVPLPDTLFAPAVPLPDALFTPSEGGNINNCYTPTLIWASPWLQKNLPPPTTWKTGILL